MRQELRYRVTREPRRRDGADLAALDVPVGRLDDDSGIYPQRLLPGEYTVSLSADPRVRRTVDLDNGDELPLALVQEGQSLVFRRLPSPPRRFAGMSPFSRTAGPWTVTGYVGGIAPENRTLRVFTTLERTPADDPATIRLPRPREALIELTPELTGDRPSGMAPARYRVSEWSGPYGFPAPAWSIAAPQWPASDPQSPGTEPARPVVQVWWLASATAPVSAVLTRGTDFVVDAPGDLNRRVTADGVDVTVASVRVEAHRVETSPGAFEIKPCLVVRLSYPPERRVWARPRDLAVLGQEHRFYTTPRGGRYTGLFWTKTPGESREMQQIELIEARRFKGECEGEKASVALTLGTPQTEAVPQPAAGGAP
jgi:hypothetical protein